MPRESTTESRPARNGDEPDWDQALLRAELEARLAEIERLKAALEKSTRRRYRRSAVGFVLLGLLGIGGAIVFPASRSVLLALGGSGVFVGLLTWYITPERFVPVSLADKIYRTLVSNQRGLIRDLGLSDTRVYVPTPRTGGGTPGTVLFIPHSDRYRLPAPDRLRDETIHSETDRSRGIALRPIGVGLFEEFERVLSGPLGDTPGQLLGQLTEGVVEQFELAESAIPDERRSDGELVIKLNGLELGTVDDLDHPAVSFIATGLAIGLNRAVRVETEPIDADDRGGLMICALEESS